MYINIKCFCTLISWEWVYGTILSLIPDTPLSLNSRVSFQEFQGGDQPNNVSVFCTLTLIDCECVYGTTLSQMAPLLV
jgi:hypothetical protein